MNVYVVSCDCSIDRDFGVGASERRARARDVDGVYERGTALWRGVVRCVDECVCARFRAARGDRGGNTLC